MMLVSTPVTFTHKYQMTPCVLSPLRHGSEKTSSIGKGGDTGQDEGTWKRKERDDGDERGRAGSISNSCAVKHKKNNNN